MATELRGERHRLAADIEGEVRRRGRALRRDLLEAALEGAVRIQVPLDALDAVEIARERCTCPSAA
jgi:hypothetical protein